MFVIVCFGKHKWWYLGNEVVRSRGSGKKGGMSSQPVGTTLASRAARQSPKLTQKLSPGTTLFVFLPLLYTRTVRCICPPFNVDRNVGA